MTAATETPVAYALAYARRGYQVIPLHSPARDGGCSCNNARCDSPAKHPRTPNGLKDGTTNPSIIRDWWRRWPRANVGIVTGAVSGIVVLDVDPDHDGDQTLADLERQYGPRPDTLTSLTGGGGWHEIYRHPGGVVRNDASRRLGLGLDIRGDGGYIVAPPSVHRSGRPYDWEAAHHPADMAEADLPAWMLARLRTPAPTPAPVDGSPIPSGQRNVTLASYAGSMRRRGMGEDAIAAALLAENAARCQPPLDEREVRDIARAIARYEPAAASVVVERGQIEAVIGPTAEHKAATPATNGKKPEARTPAPISAADLLAMDLPEPRTIVEGLLTEGATLLTGKPKMGKSWLALGLSVAIASGGRALGTLAVDAGDVLYLALEDNLRRLKKRLQGMLNGAPAPAGLYIETAWPRLDADGLKLLETWLQARPAARLIVIDTLAKIRPLRKAGQSGGYTEDYGDVEGLQLLAGEYRIAIVIVHHNRKVEADDPLDEISGTLGLSGSTDGAMVLKRERGKPLATLYVVSRDLDEDQNYAIQWDAQIRNWRIVGQAAEYQLTQERRAVIDAINRADEPIGPREIAEITGRKEGATRQLMSAMARDGLIYPTRYGKYRVATPETTYSPTQTDTTPDTSPAKNRPSASLIKLADTADTADTSPLVGTSRPPKTPKVSAEVSAGVRETVVRHTTSDGSVSSVSTVRPFYASPDADDEDDIQTPF